MLLTACSSGNDYLDHARAESTNLESVSDKELLRLGNIACRGSFEIGIPDRPLANIIYRANKQVGLGGALVIIDSAKQFHC